MLLNLFRFINKSNFGSYLLVNMDLNNFKVLIDNNNYVVFEGELVVLENITSKTIKFVKMELSKITNNF